MEEEDDFLARLGRIHKAFHGNGSTLLTRILTTSEELVRDRGCTDVHRAARPLAAIVSGEPVLHGREGATIDVFVSHDDKVGVKYARTVLESLDDGGLAIVVSLDGPTPFTRRECEGPRLQFFTARSLCVNVTHHCLVPRHTRVDAVPVDVPLDKLPRIIDTDPVVQYYGWPVGTVVRIERVFGGHEPMAYFRVVVAASS